MILCWTLYSAKRCASHMYCNSMITLYYLKADVRLPSSLNRFDDAGTSIPTIDRQLRARQNRACGLATTLRRDSYPSSYSTELLCRHLLPRGDYSNKKWSPATTQQSNFEV